MLICRTFTTLTRALSLIATFAIGGCTNTYLAGEPASWGIVTATTGFPSVQRNHAQYIVATESRIYPADIFSTDENSRLEMQLDDGTVIAIGSDAQVVLHQYTPGVHAVLNLNRGGAYFSAPTASTMRVGSSIADLTLSGGAAYALLSPTTLDAALTSTGLLTISNDDGQIVIDLPNTGTQVLPGSAPQAAYAWTPRRVVRTTESVRVNPD